MCRLTREIPGSPVRGSRVKTTEEAESSMLNDGAGGGNAVFKSEVPRLAAFALGAKLQALPPAAGGAGSLAVQRAGLDEGIFR